MQITPVTRNSVFELVGKCQDLHREICRLLIEEDEKKKEGTTTKVMALMTEVKEIAKYL